MIRIRIEQARCVRPRLKIFMSPYTEPTMKHTIVVILELLIATKVP